jgi:hypothetical protein
VKSYDVEELKIENVETGFMILTDSNLFEERLT